MKQKKVSWKQDIKNEIQIQSEVSGPQSLKNGRIYLFFKFQKCPLGNIL